MVRLYLNNSFIKRFFLNSIDGPGAGRFFVPLKSPTNFLPLLADTFSPSIPIYRRSFRAKRSLSPTCPFQKHMQPQISRFDVASRRLHSSCPPNSVAFL